MQADSRVEIAVARTLKTSIRHIGEAQATHERQEMRLPFPLIETTSRWPVDENVRYPADLHSG